MKTKVKKRPASKLDQLAEKINEGHARMQETAKSMVHWAREQGQWLAEAREECIKQGIHWLPWLEEHISYSRQTADVYLKIHRNWAKLPDAGNLTLSGCLDLLRPEPLWLPPPLGIPSGPLSPRDLTDVQAEPSRPPRPEDVPDWRLADWKQQINTVTRLAAEWGGNPPDVEVIAAAVGVDALDRLVTALTEMLGVASAIRAAAQGGDR
jgi:hypothetical protein